MSTQQSLPEQLNILRDSATVIVGIGNILKGDDGAGPLVCEQLKRENICAEVIDAGTVPENYIHSIIKKVPQNLLVIDAIDFGAAPGTIRIFEPEQLSSHVISTHSLSPRLFVDMVCQNISIDVYFVGIQPAHLQLGQSISQQVSHAIEQLSQTLAEMFPPRK
ncbi:MAG: hydrogenase 3 maturation endopeptidase HyCI [Planctomycetota bacterium]|jgi:hydrogenase 3 maturation protease